MKYKNMKKRYWMLNLQLFAEGDGDDGGDAGEDDPDEDDPEDNPEDDPEEKKFTQKDVDDAVKKRLAREKRKWQREQQKKTSGKETDGTGKAGDDGAEAKLKEAESRALKAETRAACFEAGVDKDAIEDVTALAHSYMAADEDFDLEDAIEKVVKKYPHFKTGSGASEDDAEEKKGKSWGGKAEGRKREADRCGSSLPEEKSGTENLRRKKADEI